MRMVVSKHPLLLIAFGLICAFFSSFGQTFLISLSLPYFIKDLSLTKSQFGLLYSASSIAAAFAMLKFGPGLKAANTLRYVVLATAGLVAGSCLLSITNNLAVLFLSVTLLRLNGQGFMSHISSTTMAREFTQRRGRALAIASLGYALGEAVLPSVMVAAISIYGWRHTWFYAGISVLLFGLPPLMVLSKRTVSPTHVTQRNEQEDRSSEKLLSQTSFFLDWRFLALLPASAFFPFLATALFLFQTHIADAFGWNIRAVAAGFVAYSFVRATSAVSVGALIDRLSARTLYALYLVPTGLAMLIAHHAHGPIAVYGYMIFLGLSAGMHGNIASATWAELYGGLNVARVRSVTSSLSIFAAALSPALVGWLIDHKISVNLLFDLSALGCLVCCVLAAFGIAHFRRAAQQSAY